MYTLKRIKMLPTLIVLLLGASSAIAESRIYKAKIIFHYNSTSYSYELMQAEKILENSNFVRSRPTIFHYHGYQDNADSDDIKLIVRAYRKTNRFNILILDWRELANIAYPTAVMNMEKLGLEIAKFIKRVTGLGYAINNWHLVGHSLGAQLAGIVGRQIKFLSNDSLILPRITALDPAFPGFYFVEIGPQPINKNDASFVDVIHTDAGILGAPLDTGTVDFWPNGGRRSQPGCSLFTDLRGCSHSRSVKLWIESINNQSNTTFTSLNANDPRIKAQMGHYCHTNIQPGQYKLQTNSKPPYSRS